MKILSNTHKRKKSLSDRIFVICNTIFMIAFVVVTLYPVLNTLAISFNDGTDALRGGIYLLPRKFTLKNYITVLQKDDLITGAIVTVARTVVGTLLALVSNAILAFVVSRKNFLFKKQLSLFWVITMYVNGGLIPTFLLFKGLHLTNSFWVYVIPGMVNAFMLLIPIPITSNPQFPMKFQTHLQGNSRHLQPIPQFCPVFPDTFSFLPLH